MKKQVFLVLECNGYCHRFYDEKEEKVREKLVIQKYSFGVQSKALFLLYKAAL